ncbi:acetyl-CoA synthetase [Desulfonauticus submarinus]|uniref:Acetyl-CoA synthetase n=1 Tax=Desulfonauticus submarinus TaxID=206665 RepID=A0A1H0E9E6_9BACT|nr:AMP-binding protein [Desulfonauticus submarinus]SDN78953.1 acetyl-CoA synthetase [Desulfonauticus submarinus]
MFLKQKFSSYEEFRSGFNLEIPENFNFAFDVMDKLAKEKQDEIAMIHVDDAKVRREYSYAYFARESSKLANALAKQGLKKGDRVMIVLYRRVEFWTTMLALHKLGAVAVPSPALLTAKDISFRVNFAKIKAVVVDESITARIDEIKSECPSLDIFIVAGNAPNSTWKELDEIVAKESENFSPSSKVGGNDTLLIFFSSGTTGLPKMVEHDHNYPLGHLVTGMYWHDLEPGDIHLTVADTGWGKAVWGKFYGQWMSGAIVFVYDFRGKFSPSDLLGVISEHKISTFCAPPTVYRFLVREDLTKYDLSSLRHCTTAGELLNESVFEAWKSALGIPLYEGYGQTETTLQIATFPFMKPKPGSIGKPTPGWDIVLLNDEGEEVLPGEEGEICVRLKDGRPVGLFLGYMDEPDKTAKVIKDGVYHTGDKAWMDEDGYFWFLGRVDDLIKSSGYRIGPFEVESALITHPAVVEAAVTGVPDPVRGQAVKATIVLASGYEPSEELTKDIQNHVKKVTAPYKYPRIVEYVKELPKTISGKIKRAEIRAKDMEKYK